jgi:hypothetical protein
MISGGPVPLPPGRFLGFSDTTRFASADGINWDAGTAHDGGGTALRVMMDPFGSDRIYGMFQVSPTLVRVSHSDDFGLTWAIAMTFSAAPVVAGEARLFHHNGKFWASTGGSTLSFAHSTDGTTWTVVASPSSVHRVLFPYSATEIGLGNPNNVTCQYSSDLGLTWTPWTSPMASAVGVGDAMVLASGRTLLIGQIDTTGGQLSRAYSDDRVTWWPTGYTGSVTGSAVWKSEFVPIAGFNCPVMCRNVPNGTFSTGQTFGGTWTERDASAQPYAFTDFAYSTDRIVFASSVVPSMVVTSISPIVSTPGVGTASFTAICFHAAMG